MPVRNTETVEQHQQGAGAHNARRPLEPLPAQVTSIQPGGGVVIRLELTWGRLRRWYLKTFRRGYVERMRQLRKGDFNGCPHEVLDPRDLKFHVNQGGYWWEPQDDPFRGRDRLPFVRVGLAELLVFSLLFYGGGALAIAAIYAFPLTGGFAFAAWLVAVALLVCGVLITWFFRNPHRKIPPEAGVVVSPADGKVVTIDELDYEPYIGGPAVKIGIFLSIFNVHINRVPAGCRVIGIDYKPGKFLNALLPESAQENERLTLKLEGTDPPHRPMLVSQITGQIARRIVCQAKPGDEYPSGAQFGMIKLGSRTELILPKENGLEIIVRLGQKVQAGSFVMARYR
jgi:phosphatidylserine decarboxylase